MTARRRSAPDVGVGVDGCRSGWMTVAGTTTPPRDSRGLEMAIRF